MTRVSAKAVIDELRRNINPQEFQNAISDIPILLCGEFY